MALYAIDGTTNKIHQGMEAMRNTNVKRFAEAYGGNDDPSFYEPGVGTKKGMAGKIAGSIFGAGGFSRIGRLYDNICHTYVNGHTDIDIIGFSRGAALALGLVNKLADDGIRDPQTKAVVETKPRVRFLGLWDTVGSFGMALGPFQKINIGHEMDVPVIVEHGFHALSLDERRHTFGVTRLRDQGVYEVWFRGVHSDVGGGNTNKALGNISLRWMLRKALAVGLPINPAKIPTDADIDVLAAIKEPRDPVPIGGRDFHSGDRVHYTVSPRLDGRCNNPPDTCVIETLDDELNRVRM